MNYNVLVHSYLCNKHWCLDINRKYPNRTKTGMKIMKTVIFMFGLEKVFIKYKLFLHGKTAKVGQMHKQ